MTILQSAKAPSLHAAFTNWLVSTAQGLGSQWIGLGAPPDLTSKCKWKTTILVGDALKANIAAWKVELSLLAKQRQDQSSQSQRVLGLRIKCMNHQVALIRKPIALGREHVWTSLVRLGHLFETHSFRRASSHALMSYVQADGHFIRHLIEIVFPIFNLLALETKRRFVWQNLPPPFPHSAYCQVVGLTVLGGLYSLALVGHSRHSSGRISS